MSDKKHIDRLFQEKLKDFEMSPSDAVWESIEKELHQNKRRRRVIPLWWQMAGVAAVLALLFTVGNLLLQDSSKIDPTANPIANTNEEPNTSDSSSEINGIVKGDKNENVVAQETTEDDLSSDNKSQNSVNQSTDNSVAKTSSNNKLSTDENGNKANALASNQSNNPDNSVTVASNSKSTDAITSSNLPEPNRNSTSDGQVKTENSKLIDAVKSDENTAVTNIQSQSNEIFNSNEEVSEKETKSIEEAIADIENNDEKEEVEKLSRWNISTNVAPVYFNALGNGSSLDNQFVGNSKSGQVNFSYGINGSYAVNKKFKIRAGVNKVNLGYNTNDVVVYRGVPVAISSLGARTSSNINFDENAQNTSILSPQNLSFAAVPEVISTNFKSSINQELGFIEVPVEIEYAIINKKLGVNFIGGFSTFFLNNNKIYTTLNRDKSFLGEANNINNTSYSANFGLGLNYNLSDKIKFNFEPTFKYQINTFRNTSGDFQPYLIGIYTGLSYKF